MSKIFIRYLYIVFLLIPSLASAIKIKGKVIDNGTHEPISTALVQIYDGLAPITQNPVPVGFDGTFELNLPDQSLTHVTLKFTATNYSAFSKVVPLSGKNEISLGEILLTALPNLKFYSMVLNQSADRKQNLFDITISNSSTQPVFIKKFTIQGIKRLETNCFDPSKIVVIKITSHQKKSNAVITTGALDNNENISVDGDIEGMPCEQMRLNYTIKYGLLTKPDEYFTLRVILPGAIHYLNTMRKVDLREWDKLKIQFFLDNGQIAETDK